MEPSSLFLLRFLLQASPRSLRLLENIARELEPQDRAFPQLPDTERGRRLLLLRCAVLLDDWRLLPLCELAQGLLNEEQDAPAPQPSQQENRPEQRADPFFLVECADNLHGEDLTLLHKLARIVAGDLPFSSILPRQVWSICRRCPAPVQQMLLNYAVALERTAYRTGIKQSEASTPPEDPQR